MKALTLNEPWGTLFLTPEKLWETRSRRILIRGVLAIHTSKAFPGRDRSLCERTTFKRALWESAKIAHPAQLALGSVIGVVRITGCVEAERVIDPRTSAALLPQGRYEAEFGNFTPGRFAWARAERTFRLPTPVPCPGNRGLWDLPRDVEDEVTRQLCELTGWREFAPAGARP